MKKTAFLFLLSLSFLSHSKGNIHKSDSLVNLYNNAATDSLKFIHSLSIGTYLLTVDVLKAKAYFDKASQHYSAEKNRVPQDTVYLYQSLINLNIKLASTYSYSGNSQKNFNTLFESLKYAKAIEDNESIVLINNRLAIEHGLQGHNEEALAYLRENIKLNLNADSPGKLGLAYANIGSHYTTYNHDSAIYYFNIAIPYLKRIEDERQNISANAWLLDEMGDVFNAKGLSDSAMLYYSKSLEMRKSVDHFLGQYLVIRDISQLEYNKGNYNHALNLINNGIAIAEKKGYRMDLENSYFLRSEILQKSGNYKLALEDYRKGSELKDSIQIRINSQTIIKETLKNKFKDEQLFDSLNNANEHAFKDLQILKQQGDIASAKRTRYLLVSGLSILALILGILYKNFTNRKKDTQIILTQKALLENKNREITDSISYARRIQTAILPPEKTVKEHLADCFVIYRPKDIVAGDFYWIEKQNETTLFAVADCTGHGVPGALISIVCNNALNRSVREYNLSAPGEILDKTRELVIEEFNKSDEIIHDGMDIALCSLHGNQLKYAGAHNPLWVFKNNELITVRANHEPIGLYAKKNKYVTHTFNLEKGDTVYIFSDGYVDQFGGVKGKKFKPSALKELLINIQQYDMTKQKEIIDQTFLDWKGELEQIDDICFLGIKIT